MAEDINLANLSVTLKGDFSKFLSELNNVIKNIEGINSKVTGFGNKMDKTLTDKVEKPMERVKTSSIALGSFLGIMFAKATESLMGFAAQSLQLGKEYEKTMSTIQAVTGATAKDMIKFREASVKMSEGTMFSSLQAAEAMEIFAKVGYKVEEIIGILPGTLDLAAAGAIGLAQAADIASSTIKTFGLNATDMTHVADVLAFAANETNVEVSELGESLKYAGPIAAQLGFSMEEVVGVLSKLSDFGIKACYDDQTEVLTEKGFKLFKDVTYSDKLATLNPTTDLIEYHTPQLLMRYNHSGTLVAIRGENINIKVTDNHNLYVRLKGKENFEFIEARYLKGKSFEYLYKEKLVDNPKFLIQKFNYNTSFFNTEEYLGKVYCAQVPHNLLVVKRYGVTTISGNSMAGTTLRQAMMDLFQPTKDVAILLEKYNIQVKDISGNPLPLTSIIKQLKDANIQADESFKILGARGAGLAQIMKLPTEAFESFVNSMKEGNPIIENYAKTVANIRMDNLAGDWTKLIKVIQDTGLSIYTQLTPALREMTQWLKDSAIPFFVEGLQSIGKAIGDLYYGNASSANMQNAMASYANSMGNFQAVGAGIKQVNEEVKQAVLSTEEYSKTLKYFSDASTEALGTTKTFINELGEDFTDGVTKAGTGILKLGESFQEFNSVAVVGTDEFAILLEKAIEDIDKMDKAYQKVIAHETIIEALFGKDFKAASNEIKALQDQILALIKKAEDAPADSKARREYLDTAIAYARKMTEMNKKELNQQEYDERVHNENLKTIKEAQDKWDEERLKEKAVRDAKTWDELAAALADTGKYLDKIFSDMMNSISDNLSGAFAEILKGNKSFRESMKDLWDNVLNDFYDILAKMIAQWVLTGTFVGDNGIVGNLTGGGNGGGGAAGGVIGWITKLFGGGVSSPAKASGTTGNVAADATASSGTGSSFMSGIMSFLTDMIGTLKSWLSTLSSTLWSWFSSIFSTLGSWITTIGSSLTSILGNMITTVGSWFSSIMSGLSNWFSSLFSNLSSLFSSGISTVGNWFSSLFTSMGTWFGNLFGSMGTWFSGLFEGMGGWFTNMFSSIGTWFQGMFGNIGEWFGGMYEHMGQYWEVLTKNMGGWWDKLATQFGGWFTSFFAKTASMFDEVISVMGTYFSQLVSTAVAMAKWAMNQNSGWFGTVVKYGGKAWDKMFGGDSGSSFADTGEGDLGEIGDDDEWDDSSYDDEFAKGGVITGPTRALIGEAGTEVALPLSAAPEILAETLKQAGGFGQSINVNFNGTNLFTGNKNEMDRLWREGIKSAAKRDPI